MYIDPVIILLFLPLSQFHIRWFYVFPTQLILSKKMYPLFNKSC